MADQLENVESRFAWNVVRFAIVSESFFSFREVVEAMTGKLPEIPYTACRCPETHPRLNENNPFYCMKNGVTSGGQPLKRLSAGSHPPEYMVDGGVITYWISGQVNDVTIDIELKYLKLQVCWKVGYEGVSEGVARGCSSKKVFLKMS